MIRRIAAGALALALASSCAAPALAQTVSGLALKDANGTTQNECVINAGGYLYPCHVMFGWGGSAPKLWSVDPTSGAGHVVVDSSPDLTAAQLAALSLATAAKQDTGNASAATTAANTAPNVSGAETIQAMTAATWKQVAAANASRHSLVLADAAGLACMWSLNSAPATNEGVPFSTTSSPGSWPFDRPVLNGAIYAKCTNAGTLTVVEG